MRIKIEHIPNTYNYGSLMMAINTINKLKNEFADLEIYVDTATENDYKRLSNEVGMTDLKKVIKINEYNHMNKLARNLKKIYKEAELYDLKIILGGDDISEYYFKREWLVKFPLMYLSACKIPTILIGQTIGPFTSYRRLLARLALNKTKIYTRDDDCALYLEKLGVKNVTRGRDLAFLELPNKSSKDILEKLNLINENYITVVPSGLSTCYTKNYDNYIQRWIDIIKLLLDNINLKDKKILLLTHVTNTKSDDKKVIEDIVSKLDSEILNRVIIVKDAVLASEAREILGQGKVTITGRMHAAVSTFYMRKPAISLSYSVKYKGVIGEGLDLNDLVIESALESIWSSKQIAELVNEKVNYVFNNYNQLVEKIDQKVLETSKITENQLNSLVERIREIKSKKI